jgi:hypothetical protein
MTLEIALSGADTAAAEDAAADLLREIGGQVPERAVPAHLDANRKDLATGIAAATLVLSVPGAVLATLQLLDMAARPRLRDRVDAVKKRIEPTFGDAVLTTPKGRLIDLRRTPTDAIVDAILDEFGA